MLREIVFDTETTGLHPMEEAQATNQTDSSESPHRPDKVIEIAAIEIIDYLPTGRKFYTLLNPERDIPPDATDVHGIRDEDVFNAPIFVEKYQEFLDFIGDSNLIAHNAPFDVKFINAELRQIGQAPLSNTIIDTLTIARRMFPNSPASLDALCRRFNISLADRGKHDALLDSELLARVYLNLRGGAQHTITVDAQETPTNRYTPRPFIRRAGITLPIFQPSETLRENHATYMEKKIKK